MYSYDEVRAASLDYFKGDDLAANVFMTKYALKDGAGNYLELTPDDLHHRLAREFARIESKYGGKTALTEEQIYDSLKDFKHIVAQGSPSFGIGNDYVLTSLSNCLVVRSPEDNMSSIFEVGKQLANLFKARCGVGLDISTLRPEGSRVSNAAGTSSGAWSFADLYSYITRMIGQGGRRGALILTMDVRHPDIDKFVAMKADLSKVTGANISVRLSDEFMRAVEGDTEFCLKFPVDSDTPKVSRTIKAKELWELIIKTATETAEPGILFWDTIKRRLPAEAYADVGFKTTSVNPCAELCLADFDSCRLISLNLKHFITDPFTRKAAFDFELFSVMAARATRLGDDLVDLEVEKLDRIIAKADESSEKELWQTIKEKGLKGRRIGIGTHALADALARLCVAYDSSKALEYVDQIYSALKLSVYGESVKLARERGAFPVFDWEKDQTNEFIQDLPDELRKDLKRYGRRNIALLTNAPTGSISILCQTSSGIEPVFKNAYTRRKKLNPNDVVEGREVSVDALGDKWISFDVAHQNVRDWSEATGKGLDELPKYFIESHDINWNNRIELQAIAQKHIDHSISSCLAAGNHMVATDKGLMYLEEVFSDGRDKSFVAIPENITTTNHLGAKVKIDEGFVNGTAECLNVLLEHNEEIIGTPNHKLFVLGDKCEGTWKRLDELSKGDVIIGRKGLRCFGDSNASFNSVLGEFKHSVNTSGNTKKIRIPYRMSCDLARLLGYIISDGGIGENGVALSQLKNNVVDDFISIMYSVFDIKCSISEDNRCDGLLSVQANSRILRDFLCQYLGISRDGGTKQIPKVIFQCAGGNQAAEFLKGITLDGHVGKEYVCPMTTISKNLAKEIQLLLNQFGIESGIFTSKEAFRVFPSGKGYFCKEAYHVICSGENANRFVDMIGFAEERKVEESRTKFKRPSRTVLTGTVPSFGLRQKIRSTILPMIRSNKLYNHVHSMTCKSKSGLGISRDNLLFLADLGAKIPDILLDDTYRFVKVKAVRPGGTFKTYDLHVKDGNSYLVNGLISHNTINLPKGVAPEVVGQLYFDSWKKGLKGVTVYVDGSRAGVLVAKKESRDLPKRPDELSCFIHHVSVKGQKWLIMVGMMNDRPYEIFGGVEENLEIPRKYTVGKIVKVKGNNGINTYNLCFGEDGLVKDIGKMFDNTNYQVHTRLISLGLRHGARPNFLVEQLLRDSDNDLTSFSRAISRVLKKYIEDGTKVASDKVCGSCGQETLQYRDSCITCSNCGWSKCS